jgi:hypothetical protein
MEIPGRKVNNSEVSGVILIVAVGWIESAPGWHASEAEETAGERP